MCLSRVAFYAITIHITATKPTENFNDHGSHVNTVPKCALSRFRRSRLISDELEERVARRSASVTPKAL